VIFALDFPTDIPTISHLSSSSISIPSIEIASTSIIPALSTEFTATPHVLSTTPVHVTSTPVTSTTPTPRLTGDCNRVTVRDRFRHPPARRIAPLVPSSHPHGSLSYSSVVPSRKRRRSSITLVTTTAHTPVALTPTRADLLLVHKRVRGSAFDYEASVEDGMEADAKADREADAEAGNIAADAEADAQIGVEPEIEAKAEESDRDTIKIGVDVVHPEIDTPTVFLVATIVVRLVEQEEAIQGIHEHLLKMPTQRVRSLWIIEMRLHSIVWDEREARARIERHLGLVQEEIDKVGCPTVRTKIVD
ncbi:hypothetical protein Tco_1433520, partial [Tanacetum coccineum]